MRTGTVLMGKWRIVRELAHGGTSTVYEAVHRNGRRAAVKLLRPSLAADRRGRARFLRESALANRVNHPGVISVLDEDVTPEGLVFLVMELLAGETLEQRWTRLGKRLPVQDAVDVAIEILQPLVAVHRVGIVHRDLKPSNVFLSTTGIKLLDFGVARLREINAEESAITRSGAMLGTPAFMAPEQARGHWYDIDVRTDIWAVGAILFVLLSGRYVHEGRTPNDLLIASATQPAESLTRVAPDVPARLVALVDRALSRDKSQRWPDAASMLAELRAIKEILPGIQQSTTAPPERDERPSVATIPEMRSLDVAAKARGIQSRTRRASALLIAVAAMVVLITGTVVSSRTTTTSRSASASATARMVPILHTGSGRDASASLSQLEDAPKESTRAPRPGAAPLRSIRARRLRTTVASPGRDGDSKLASTSDAGSLRAPAPQTPPEHQTFSGIVVEDDALDQRR